MEKIQEKLRGDLVQIELVIDYADGAKLDRIRKCAEQVDVEYGEKGISVKALMQPQTAGFGEVLVQPYLPERMRRVDCSYRSANGKIRVEMEETEAEIRVRITAPEKMQVRFDSKNLENRNKKIIWKICPSQDRKSPV